MGTLFEVNAGTQPRLWEPSPIGDPPWWTATDRGEDSHWTSSFRDGASIAFDRRLTAVLDKHKVKNNTTNSRIMPLGQGPLKDVYGETERIDDCQECVDDRSCANATFACATQCVGIVP